MPARRANSSCVRPLRSRAVLIRPPSRRRMYTGRTLTRISRSSSFPEVTDHLANNGVQVRLAALAEGGDPRIELGTPNEHLAARPVARKWVRRVVEVLAQLPDTDAAVAGERLQR